MTANEIVRAWKDADYGATLSRDEASRLPENPIGAIDLPEEALDLAAGGRMIGTTEYLESLGCCQGFTQASRCDLTAGMPGMCSVFCFTFFMTSGSIC